MNRSSTAQHKLRQLVSPGKRPITFVRRLTSSNDRFVMLHGDAVEVEVPGVDRLLVEQLVELGPQILSQLFHCARARWSRRVSMSITPETYVEPAP